MTKGRRRLAVAAVVAGVGLLAAAAAAARPAGPPDNPRLAPGAHVVVREGGFAPATAITIGLVGDRLLGTLAADAHGRIAYRYTVPAGIAAGQHALVFAGAPAHLGRSGRPGNVDVAVPLVRSWRFRTPAGPPGGGASAPASGPPGHSGHPGGSGSAGAGHGTRDGGTSSTGADVLLPLALGVLALVAGGALVLAARRRA